MNIINNKFMPVKDMDQELQSQFERVKKELAIAEREKAVYHGPCEKCLHFKFQPWGDSNLCQNPLLLNYKFNKTTGEIEGSLLSTNTARKGICGENGYLFSPKKTTRFGISEYNIGLIKIVTFYSLWFIGIVVAIGLIIIIS